jgi:predicted nucleotidyltransferase
MPSEAVVPTLDGPVLVTLARLNSPVSGRRVHQLCGMGSEAGVRNVLNRLTHQGLVHASEAGSAVLYALNRDHLAWPAVEALAGIRGELLARLRGEFGTWAPRARAAALFGSAARGDGNADSDIDILLIRQRRTNPDTEAWKAQTTKLRENVTAWTGNLCQLYDIGSDDLETHIRAGEPILAEWRRDAITLAGADLRRLLRDLGHRISA